MTFEDPCDACDVSNTIKNYGFTPSMETWRRKTYNIYSVTRPYLLVGVFDPWLGEARVLAVTQRAIDDR